VSLSFPPTNSFGVLLVDDTPDMLSLYGRMLGDQGYRISLADGGPEALALLEHETPDLIVLDCAMPRMSGPETLAELRRVPRLARVPVIFLTSSRDDDENVERAFALGVSDYITKPVNRHVFVARVKALIGAGGARAARRESANLTEAHTRLREDVDEARALQRAQLPLVPVRRQHWQVAAALEPCAEVGGDLFDIIEGSVMRPTVALIDVSGHGIAAAMVASAVRATLRLLLRTVPFDRVMSELNRQLLDGPNDHYACLALVQLDGECLHVVNAGLPPVAIVVGGAMVAEVVGSGPPAGLLADAEYEQQSFRVVAGTRIVLTSDGLTEPFGQADDIGSLMNRLSLFDDVGGDVEKLCRSLSERLRRLFGPHAISQTDDAAVVVVDCLSAPAT
jgi:DNA-binding response OmpR family regulator